MSELSELVISDAVRYIGVDDHDLDLFESQYRAPNGVSYNSYVILDEKIAVMDTADRRVTEQWFANLEAELGERTPDYLIVSHMEPDHAANVKRFLSKYPEAQIVGNAKTFGMLLQFFEMGLPEARKVVVKEGDELSLGEHTLVFFMAPMVHWPEVMVEYEKKEKILFSADGFGKFGALDVDEDWTDEARRYYINICGKYGVQVQALLKKAAALDIEMICPLHGPILKGDLGHYIEKYSVWSSYEPEESGILVAYASIHGNTAEAAERFAKMLVKAGEKHVKVMDLSRDDMSEAVADAFRYDRMVLACATYDGGMFPCMDDFLHHLQAKSCQKRTVGLIENGSWGPMAAKKMRESLDRMKDITVADPVVTIKSALKRENEDAMQALVAALVK